MAEIRSSVDFRNSVTVQISDTFFVRMCLKLGHFLKDFRPHTHKCLDFRQVQISDIQVSDFTVDRKYRQSPIHYLTELVFLMIDILYVNRH